jgi:photoactive yellow protein
MTFEILCAWCGKAVGQSTINNSHGICDSCFEFVLGVPNLSQDEIEILPFGVIWLNKDGVVLGYNSAEQQLSQKKAQDVLRRNFFTEIAPCTQVKNFQGRFQKFLGGERVTQQFDFVFNFQSTKIEVNIVFVRQDAEHVFVLVKKKM